MKYKKCLLLLTTIFLFNINITVYAANKDSFNELNYNYDNTNNIVNIAKSSTPKKYSISGYNNSNNKITCGQLIDSSTKKLINDILKYPRYAVPAIIIVLGSLDFFKAVIAGKEDEMKKAQRTFIKRVIIGVAVFLVPLLVNVIIWFANLAWSGLGYGAPCPIN